MCSICLQPIESHHMTRELKCDHIFHAECFDIWGNNGSDFVSCPLCRKKYRKKYLHYNPPHFVILRPKEPNKISSLSDHLRITAIIATICFLKSLFDRSPINQNWGLTQIWFTITIVFIITIIILNRY